MERNLAFLLLCLLLSNCSWNYQNVEVSGFVKDEYGLPIHGAVVKIKCWVYSTKTWDSFCIDKQVQTDQEGYFNSEFSEGELLELQTEASGYLPADQGGALTKSVVHYNFTLKRL